ncbi:NUDIX domain-containing protein [Actinocrinis puniceicyclus]|uniref:NUDIX domain-containing protein n=1 Tax=Actinocrinis puniceicyclus TaxID=977794 RepID=A0A8J7WQK2_9ACTN|nr:NUDIX domain-containing protein [Actinocrinis puniceicyclus]MBS2964955.1 NUDIX domain-containing protein [Actinocrinis puniceicyclus]
MIKHLTASVFVFARIGGEWRVAMVQQPRLGKRMIPGGHVEDDETAAEAGERETEEETGLRGVKLLEPARPDLPSGYPHPRMPQPWWVSELRVPADNHLGEPHVHVDHVFVALADPDEPAGDGVHETVWMSLEELLEHPDVFEDTKLLAKELFPRIGEIAPVESI